MKVVFLDIDGVLVTWSSMQADHLDQGQLVANFHSFDPNCVARLNRITGKSNAVIVVSSTWRHGNQKRFEALKRHLRRQGVKARVVGRTPELLEARTINDHSFAISAPRGNEIQYWLEHSGHDVEGFVILDDDSDMDHLEPRHVLTSMQRGLDEPHVALALSIIDTPRAGAA